MNKSLSSIGSEPNQLTQDEIKEIAFNIYDDLISNYISEEKVFNFAL